MTSKPPKRRAKSRRPKMVPARPYARHIDVAFIKEDDLTRLAQHAGLPPPPDPQLQRAVTDINRAMHEACHVAMLDQERNFAELAAWCRETAIRARELASSLESATLEDETAPYDALRLLAPGLPAGDDEGARSMLERHFVYAIPSKLNEIQDELFTIMLARLPPALRALDLVAGRAEAHWVAKVKRGGTPQNRARRHLMSRLADAYELQFGRRPTITVSSNEHGIRQHAPGGRSIEWFKSLFTLIKARAPDHVGAKPLQAIAIEAYARSDALANWVREAALKGK